MKVVQVHKYWWHRDGASNYVLELTDLLRKRGHEVIPFSMQEKETLATPYSRFFVPNMNIGDPRSLSLRTKIKDALRMIYYTKARRNMRALLNETKPDLVHLHNIYHHISPSILPEIKKRGIPIVMTLHDYKLICPNYTMFHHGRVHEEDARFLHVTCVKNKCVKDSRVFSAVAALEMFIHHKLMRVYARNVDYFISPSQFVIDMCVKHGWPRKKFIHIPHAIETDLPLRGEIKDAGYAMYMGRLSEEKGLDVLFGAAKLTPEIPYKIVGTGPLEAHLISRIKHERITNIEMLGYRTGKPLQSIVAQARLTVVPSVWYENYPLSVLEPKAIGKVVLGSRIGGIPEILDDRFLFEAGNPQELAKKVKHWYNVSTAERRAMGIHNQTQTERVNDPELHMKRILKLYRSLV